MESKIRHLLSDARGIYIPRDFVQGFAIECKEEDKQAAIDGKAWKGIKANDVIVCNDPDHEWYWDAWDSILNNAYWIDSEGHKWTLHQNGNLWAIRDDMTEEEWEEFSPC